MLFQMFISEKSFQLFSHFATNNVVSIKQPSAGGWNKNKQKLEISTAVVSSTSLSDLKSSFTKHTQQTGTTTPEGISSSSKTNINGSETVQAFYMQWHLFWKGQKKPKEMSTDTHPGWRCIQTRDFIGPGAYWRRFVSFPSHAQDQQLTESIPNINMFRKRLCCLICRASTAGDPSHRRAAVINLPFQDGVDSCLGAQNPLLPCLQTKAKRTFEL